jgi:putative ABC transport system ATP-binding protein
MITLKNIKKTYTLWKNNIDVLKWVDLEIKSWDFVSIMGPSWSWKSTLMNIIGMLDVASFWEYFLDNFEITWKTEDELSDIRAKNIWFVFQSYNLIPRMNVLKQVILPLSYQKILKQERLQQAKKALMRVWLWDKLDSKPNELSWWQQQRVSIARAIVGNPNFILADEPTWALDSVTSKEIMTLLQELNAEWTTIILITHEKEVEQYAKTHIYIKDGLIVNEI